jgi:hypothetical protein
MDVEKLADSLLENVRGFVTRTFQPLADRVKALEDRPLPEAIKGDKGDSVTPEDVLPILLAEAGRAIAAIPTPQDGKSVTLADVEPMLEAMHAKWALDFERRAQGVLERAVDRIPKPKDGKNGVDALGFDDLTVEHDGERGFAIKFVRGDQVKQFDFAVPVVLDRGFWAEGKSAEQGDGYTFGGSYWIAQRTTATKPETGNPDWRLAVKKGRDLR